METQNGATELDLRVGTSSDASFDFCPPRLVEAGRRVTHATCPHNDRDLRSEGRLQAVLRAQHELVIPGDAVRDVESTVPIE